MATITIFVSLNASELKENELIAAKNTAMEELHTAVLAAAKEVDNLRAILGGDLNYEETELLVILPRGISPRYEIEDLRTRSLSWLVGQKLALPLLKATVRKKILTENM